MKLLTLVALGAAVAFGMPVDEPNTFITSSGLKIRGLGYQGDGFYVAKFNKDGVADVEYTPFGQLNQTALTEESARIATIAAEKLAAKGPLAKREGTSCISRTGFGPDNDVANIQLAHNANGNFYEFHHWGWVHYSGVTSYFCPYQRGSLTYDLVIQFQTDVSNTCGGSDKLGFERHTHGHGVEDMAIGRTWLGDNFCESGFYG